MGDTDDDEYVQNTENLLPVDFNTLVNIEPAVLSVYNMPVGTELEFHYENGERYFINTNTGEKIK